MPFFSHHVCVWLCVYNRSGFLDSEPLREADEDSVSEVNLNNSMMTEEEREEIQQELAKVCLNMHVLKLKRKRDNDNANNTSFCVYMSSWKRRSAPWSRFCHPKRSSMQTSERNWASLLWASSETTSAEAGMTCRPPWRKFKVKGRKCVCVCSTWLNDFPVFCQHRCPLQDTHAEQTSVF